jgi:hypothetical protein
MRLRTLGLGLMLFVALLPAGPHGTALAQEAAPSAAASASAREAFKRGEAAYSAGNYDAALREWNAAYSADPRPRIQFNLAQAYERMGRLEDAVASLKRFLESSDPEDPTYSDANARYVALQQRLAATGVTVTGGAEGGAIFVDEQDWGRTPRPDKITVTPGNHVVVVRWPSGQEYRTNVYVPAGQVVPLSINDDGTPAAAAAPNPVTTVGSQPSTAPAAPRDDHKRKEIILYSVGGGVAAIGVGLLAYGISRGIAVGKCGERDSLGLQNYCNPDSEDSAKAQSIAGYAVGGVLLAGGAALLVYNVISSRHDDAQRAQTRCGLGLASASCTFRF